MQLVKKITQNLEYLILIHIMHLFEEKFYVFRIVKLNSLVQNHIFMANAILDAIVSMGQIFVINDKLKTAL